jgi:aspartyl-tRNA(Asn)/glutamyl-tRNA(Gln) amidotransferase subunit C
MTRDDLKVTAELAHLNLKDEELDAAFPSFQEMLGYFAAMQAADKDPDLSQGGADVKAGQNVGAQSVGAGFFRKDEEVSGGSEKLEMILDNAGERDGRFYVIPSVL